MRVLNLIWGFTLGAGIDKCFVTYAKLGEVDKDVEVKSVCINLLNIESHLEPLEEIHAEYINIRSRKDFSWVWKLRGFIKDYKPDVIFTHGFNGAIMMLIQRVLFGGNIPIICTYHGGYHAPTRIKKLIEPIYNSLSILLYKRVAKRVICVENYSREYLVSRGVPNEKVFTVHNGIKDIHDVIPVNVSLYSSSSCPIIMTASRITEVKGLLYLLDALKVLKDNKIRFHYIMIGEGPDLEKLISYAKNLGLSDEITFAGFQSNVAEWLAACDIFALPSLYEYHSIAILEAMRAEKAIIATAVGGNGESIKSGEEGILIPSRDPIALANALETLLLDKKMREQFGKRARKRFESEFTEYAMMTNMVRAIKNGDEN